LLRDRKPKLFKDPLRQIDEAPAHDAKDSGDGAIRHYPPKRLALAVVENASSARALPFKRPSKPLALKRMNYL
jgi:hypothetical protein